jgi:signal transduction histidine kinase
VSIRFKVILPYLLLTLVVAITGVYVVTKLVANSLSERLTNQLLEAGRVVSDGMARQDNKHIEVARLINFTVGLREALQKSDAKAVATLARPVAGGLDAENLILLDLQGQEMLHFIKGANRTFEDASGPSGAANWAFVQTLLKSKDGQGLPQRGIMLNQANKRRYYYTAIPISANDQMVGVVVVGTSLDTLLSILKSTSLADVTIYEEGGQAVGTTMADQGSAPGFLDSLAIKPDLSATILSSDNAVTGENFSTDGRWYSLARGSLRVSGDRLGIFAVILPLDFVITSGADSRNTYIWIFAFAMVAVILLGYIISRLIISPLYSLMRTSQAITNGDLTQRTGVHSKDEIGTLARTFDEMTERLQQRSAELERTNAILEQMDKTKENFISVSAHELRTPLTLIQGYSQMLQSQTDQYPNLKPLAKGLVEGSDRMLEVVNSMLDVTRIDANMLKPMLANLQIVLIVMRAQKTFKEALKERNQTLITDGLNELPVVVADADLMYKVFYHIVMNAIKYTPDGGKITISGRVVDAPPPDEKQELEIVIHDTGIGIDKQHHVLVFEKFYQTGELNLHSSGRTKFRGGGPGLGLAIARGIVEAHHGRIWVESPGYDDKNFPGSSFFIRLPLDLVREQ